MKIASYSVRVDIPRASYLLAIVFLLMSLNPAAARGNDDTDTLVFESGLQRVAVIELYTSEGCSSCPPAEAYLNGLKDHPRLWQRYIPMAFHVDYWDYLGWKDPYAEAAYTKRQRRYARYHRARTVYTPAFFVNGEPWRNASMEDTPSVDRAEVGQLRVELAEGQVLVSFEPLQEHDGPLSYNIVLLGMGLESSINRGERAGGHARHEFVVLKRLMNTNNTLHWQTAVPSVDMHPASSLAIAAWVSEPDAPMPLQATGGYLRQNRLE